MQELALETVDGKPRSSFAFADQVATLLDAPEPPARIRVLSPFDPLIRDRNRTERLFGFFYRIEVFVPEPKRQYGYYVFPLLEGDRLIGRIDMKAERREGLLDVRRLWLNRASNRAPGASKSLMPNCSASPASPAWTPSASSRAGLPDHRKHQSERLKT